MPRQWPTCLLLLFPPPPLRAVQPAILMKFLTNVYLAEVTMAMRAKRVLPSSTTSPLFLPPLPFATPIPNSEGSCTARRVPQTQTRVPHNFLQNESINEAFRGQLRVVNRIATERVYRGSNLPPVPPSLPLSLPPFLHCKCNLQLGLFSVFSLWSSSRNRK